MVSYTLSHCALQFQLESELESLICPAVYMESVRGVVCAVSDVFPHVLRVVGQSCLQCSTTMRECCHSVFVTSDSAVAVVLILSHIADTLFSVCRTLRLHVLADAIMSEAYDCLSVFYGRISLWHGIGYCKFRLRQRQCSLK